MPPRTSPAANPNGEKAEESGLEVTGSLAGYNLVPLSADYFYCFKLHLATGEYTILSRSITYCFYMPDSWRQDRWFRWIIIILLILQILLFWWVLMREAFV